MRREDWFWVAVKVIGLWFAVDGVVDLVTAVTAGEALPHVLGSTFVLPAVATAAAGLFLLFAGDRLVPPGPERGPAEASGRIDAVGLFWAASKVIGLLTVLFTVVACTFVLALPEYEHSVGMWKGRCVLTALPVLALGLWLLLGETVFRAASRNA